MYRECDDCGSEWISLLGNEVCPFCGSKNTREVTRFVTIHSGQDTEQLKSELDAQVEKVAIAFGLPKSLLE